MIGGFIGKAIGEPISGNKSLSLDNAALTLTGQTITLTAQAISPVRRALLRGTGALRTYWKGRS